MSTAAPHAYLRDAVMTASAEQLHLMLYDGAIRFSLQAKDALALRNYEASYTKLSRAQAIVMEMYHGLRHEANPELCKRMAAIYMFIYRKLVDGSVHRDPGQIDEALKVLRYQRETWVLLMDKVNSLKAEEAGPAGPAGSFDPHQAVGAALCVEG